MIKLKRRKYTEVRRISLRGTDLYAPVSLFAGRKAKAVIMEIKKTEINGNLLTIAIEGRLDSITSPKLEEFFKTELDGVERLILDMDKLEYISSAGLRVLLSTSKALKSKGGAMKLINVDDYVEDVLMMTGFRRVFAIETKNGHNLNPELF